MTIIVYFGIIIEMAVNWLDDRWAQATYVNFEDIGRLKIGAKTKLFRVTNRAIGMVIGYIQWKPTWRRYVYCPEPDTIYDPKCMREIADFCEDVSRQHFDKLKENK